MPPVPNVDLTPVDDDDDDRTVVAPPRVPRAAWVLVTPSGDREALAGTVVVGRQPAKTAFKGADKTLKLVDPTGQISKSHAVFEADSDGLWIRDLASTNGVVVVAPSHEETVVSGDARISVASGSQVEFGPYVLTVERV